MAEQLLTREQVVDVIQFADSLYLAETAGVYSPWMSNDLLIGLNNNPLIPTYDKIKEALASYKSNSKDLQAYTEFMENYDMIFKRTLYSYVNTLAFDLEITCTNAYTQADYESPQYQQDKIRVYQFLDKFDYKKEFRQVVMQLLRNEVYYAWFRRTKWGNKGMKCTLQIMPQAYCMMTGYWEKGILFDFDLNYFLQIGVDIDGFDPVFKQYYNDVFGVNAKTFLNYRPTNPLNDRNGQYAYWTQTSPEDGAWCFKLNPSNFTTVPFLSPFLKDTIRNDEIGQLQYDKDILTAHGILVGDIRVRENRAAGDKPDQFTLNTSTLQAFMRNVNKGLGNLYKAVAMPTESSKFYQFSDSNPNMYQDQLSNSAGVGSGISRVIYSSDRMSNAEVEAGIIDQYNTMAAVYPQFDSFLDFWVNKLTKRYKFKFTFKGCSYPFERQKRIDNIVKLADKGMVLGPTAFAAAFGYKPQDFERQMQEAKWSNFNQLWQLPLNTFTASSGGSGEGPGRPEADDGELSESGEMNRDSQGEL